MPAWCGIQHGSKSPLMQNQLFEAALGIAKPWCVRGIDFDAARKVLTIGIDFVAGSRFAAPGVDGMHRVHDTQTKRLRHLNFFQHECYLEVRTPRVKLPDGRVVQIEPDWFGKLSGFTPLFEALVAGHGPADDLCRGRQAGRRILAPRAWFTLCRSRRGRV